MPTKIEWAEESWNPVTGCTPVSEGCQNCYAARMARRLAGRCGYPADEPFRVTLHPERLEQPAKWRKPRRIFVCSMGDLFHPDIRWEYIYDVFLAMYNAGWHTFLVITKRPERMKAIIEEHIPHVADNIWLGVTAENQARGDERIPVLLSIPAAVHFVSIEPCLGPVDLLRAIQVGFGRQAPLDNINFVDGLGYGLDWVILGCETGPGRRTMQPVWARDVKDQCVAAGVPLFLKQMYRNDGTLWKLPQLDGQIWNQYPNNERNPNA